MRLGLRALVGYGAPGLPIAALGVPLYIFLPTFYATELGLSLQAIGLILFYARIWDVVTDPLIGTLSDRTTSRLGRRRPWMIASVPVLGVSVWMLFLPPEGADSTHLAIWSVGLYLGWTMLQLPHSAWGAEMSDDYHERSRIAAAREICVVVGTLIAAGMPLILKGFGQPDDLSGTMSALGMGLAIALPVAVTIAAFSAPERMLPRIPGPDWRQGLRLVAANRPFLRLISAHLINGLGNGFAATLFVLFVTQGLDAPGEEGAVLFVYFLAGIIGVPIWLRLSHAWGKHHAWRAAMVLNCVAFLPVPFLGPGDLMIFFVVSVVSGLAVGADLVLPSSMQADVIDVERAKTEHDRTGVYFALWGMATKLSLAGAVGIAFPVLDLAGFSAEGPNDADALLTLALLYAVAPIILKSAAFVLMSGYPLDAAAQTALRDEIRAKKNR